MFVAAMKSGNNLVVDCDTMIIPFKKSYDGASLPLEKIFFDSDKMFDDNNEEYKSILKAGENKDMQGN